MRARSSKPLAPRLATAPLDPRRRRRERACVRGACARSAVTFRAPPRRGAGRPIELIISPAVLGEVAAVLARPRLRRYLSLDEAERFVADLAGVTAVVADPPRPYPEVCRDPADDYLVALALETRADALVTGDLDLLVLEGVGLPVITPRELAERLEHPE